VVKNKDLVAVATNAFVLSVLYKILTVDSIVDFLKINLVAEVKHIHVFVARAFD
jgi:hypothetical protein